MKGQQVTLEVFDHDDTGDDDFLGRATVQTSVVAARGEIKDMWVELEDVKSGRAQMSLEWRETSMERTLIKEQVVTREETDMAKCILHVYVDSCKNIVAKGGDNPSPMVSYNLTSYRVILNSFHICFC